MTKNRLQEFLTNPNNIHHIINIIKLYHPDILEEYPSKHKKDIILKFKDYIEVYVKYDWVCIEVKKGGIPHISIGIQFNCTLMSGYKPLEKFEESLVNDKFKAWRFYDDSKYNNNWEKITISNPDIHEMFIKLNIPKPTAQEMYYNYNK